MSSKLGTMLTNIRTFAATHKGLLIGGVVLLCGISAFIYYQYTMSNQEVVLTPEFEDDQERDMQEASVEAGIQIPGYSTIVFYEGKSEAEVDFFNPDENNVYFQITLQLVEEETVLYQSKLIEPGQHIYNIELLEQLEAGEYDMTIFYETFSTDGNFTPKNGASVNCILEVK